MCAWRETPAHLSHEEGVEGGHVFGGEAVDEHAGSGTRDRIRRQQRRLVVPVLQELVADAADIEIKVLLACNVDKCIVSDERAAKSPRQRLLLLVPVLQLLKMLQT